jgi:type II secretory pathway pseudopilin PulG
MALDPNIALGVRQIELPNQLAQYAQLSQIQSAQNQNRMAEMQLQEYARARGEEEGLRNYLAKGDLSTPDARKGLFQFGKTGREYIKTLTEQEAAALTAKNVQSQIDEREFGTRKKKLDFAWSSVGSAPTPQDAIAKINEGVKTGVFDMKTASAELQQLQNMTPEQYQQYRVQKVMGILDAKDKLGFMLPKVARQDIGGSIVSIQDNPALPGYGLPIAGAAIKKTATAGDLLTDARAKENIQISRTKMEREADPVFQQTMAAAKETGVAIAKGDVAAKQALPKIISDAQLALDVVDQMVGKQEVRDKNGKVIQAATKPHPGFQDAVGATYLPGARFVPGTNAASFQALQNQVEGTAFLSAFEALKGGGAISEKEGEKATAARMRMTLAQNEQEYIKAAREFQDIVRTGVQNAQRKAGGAAAAGGAGGVDTSNPLLK